MLTEFWSKNLDIAFLIYGAAFFAMGVIIFAQPKRAFTNTVFRLSDIIWQLALFGIIRGLNQWFYMIAMMRGYSSNAVDLIWITGLILSYVFIFEFGRRLILLNLDKFLNGWVTIVLSLLVFGLVVLNKGGDIWPRYLLGFPGGIMAGFGFVLYYRSNAAILGAFGVRRYFLIAAVSIVTWSIFSCGVPLNADFFPASVINEVSFLNYTGIPVYLFRAISAVLVAWSVWKILGIFNLEVKTTLSRRMEEAVTANNYARSIIETMTCSLVVVDLDGKIGTVNKATCDLLGYKEEELIGRPAREILEDERVLKGTTLNNFPLTFFSKKKRAVPTLSSCSLLKNGKGKSTGIICVGKDMSEIKDMQEKLMGAEKLAAMGKVASIIGHEFRNQLGIIGISTYFLKTKLQEADEKVKKHLAILEHQVMESSRIVENILAYSRSGELERKSLDLGNVLLANIDRVPNPNKISIVTKIDNGLPQIEGDEIRLGRVFVNVITNALQAMGEKGGILTIRAGKAGNFLEVLFEDTGFGIREEDKEKLFTPFFSTKPRGIGLGLALCKNIMEMHNGSIDIKSEPGKGTVVTVRLPTKG